MNDRVIVTVLMTAFNREKYIAEAIESVLASTLTNFELIIVDDCSKDRTIEIARSFENSDSRVKVYQNERNLGDYPNRNKAASYAKGKYIKYVDADDYLYPNGLEIIVGEMEKFPDASVGLFSLPQHFKKPFPILLNSQQTYEYNFFGPGLFYKAPLSAIFKTAAFINIGGFGVIRHAGDFEMWHRIAQKHSFLLIHDHIVWFREHDDQESKKHDVNVELMYSRIEKSYIFDKNSPLNVAQRTAIRRNKVKKSIKRMIIALMKFDFSDAFLSQQRMLIYLGWKK
jgi:glycosyltransferase involved in cell wall biosynthesis